MKAVIDTNVLRVASEQHAGASPDCVAACVCHLLELKRSGVAVIDDGYRILGEYQRNPDLLKTHRMGGQFLKWLLQNKGVKKRVAQVPLTEAKPDHFKEFPDPTLERRFDPPDRKFVAVANAHPERPPIWQAADSKWLDWWPQLASKGIRVRFLCPGDVRQFYAKKFPGAPIPELPEA